MDRARIFIASALFIALTLVKLLLPAQMDALRAEAARLAGAGAGYEARIGAIGRSLGDRELAERLAAVFREFVDTETGE